MPDLSVNIDFLVANNEDPRYIVVTDISNWGVAETHPSYLQVLLPGASTPINLSFVKQSMTILHSVNLGLTSLEPCSEQEYVYLPDGVYEICLLSSFDGLSKKRWLLKDDTIRMEMSKLYIKKGLDYDPTSPLVEHLFEVEWMLSVAKAEIKEGDYIKAKRAYDEARKTLDKYLNCKNCY